MPKYLSMYLFKNIFLLSFAFLYLVAALNAQQTVSNRSDAENAYLIYKQNRYEEAIVSYRKLLEAHPNDSMYNYYAGVCLIRLKAEPKKAIEYLLKASEKKVPNDVYFFLGRAYHLSFLFSDAINAYSNFKTVATAEEKKQLNADLQIKTIENTKKSCTTARQVVFQKKALMKTNKVTAFINSQAGVPEETQFYSEMNKQTYNFDLYSRSKAMVLQDPFKELNSDQDEDFPYYDKKNKILYFCSKGHNSLGGFDIFYSVYDNRYNTWTKPINMGFPINTPFDEYYFVPVDSNKAWFASNRETKGGDVTAFFVKFNSKFTPLDSLTPSFLEFTASLKPKPKPIPIIDTLQLLTSDSLLASQQSDSTQTFNTPTENSESMNKAFTTQLKVDSMLRLAEQKRMILASTTDPTQQNTIKREIYLLKKQADDLQLLAIALFEKKSEIIPSSNTNENIIEEQNSENRTVNFPAPQKKTEIIDEIKTTEPTKNTSPVTPKQEPVIIEEKQTVVTSSTITTKETTEDFSSEMIYFNYQIPKGIVYRIQIGAFSNQKTLDFFKNLRPIFAEKENNATITKYFYGLFTNYNKAINALEKAQTAGFKDCYIVSYQNGTKISTERAKELENLTK